MLVYKCIMNPSLLLHVRACEKIHIRCASTHQMQVWSKVQPVIRRSFFSKGPKY